MDSDDVRMPLKRNQEQDTAAKVKRFRSNAENGHADRRPSANGSSISTGTIPEPTIEKLDYQLLVGDVRNAQQWQATVSKVIKSVVAVRFAQVAPFDSDEALVSEATGFVVDAERGIILTNRHVVCAGPFVGYAIFDNHEETEVKPMYRDPVHDFGFLKFDPKKIKYMKVTELTLRPDLAKVGCEIRVVGNDAGEKLSILSGFISRVDRNAPDYGALSYNDFNTEYIQAAASASGGSSGSPVIDIDGNTLALQAGGSTESATDFFLPVYRVLRALRLVQQNQPITRGTIQVQWLLKPFDQCRRLGLSEEAEDTARNLFPDLVGLLVAEIIVPEGPADPKIKEGDILISINGKDISTFIQVDDILDSSVDKSVHIKLQRNGKYLEVECNVQDLHSITPSRYVEICGASFNDMSYQMARIYVVPIKGVFVNNAGGTFNIADSTTGWIIDAVDNKPTPDLDTFVKVMQQIPDRKYFSVSYKYLGNTQSPNVALVFMNRHWYGARIASRNDETGLWDFTDLADPVPEEPLKPLSAKFIDLPNEEAGCSKLVRSFVYVSMTLPVSVDSFPFASQSGYGLVIDAEKGYVLVSRKCAPHDLCEFNVTIAESIIIPAKVVFMHPLHNYSIIQYNPKLVLAPVTTPKFSNLKVKRGEKLNFLGYHHGLTMLTSKINVTGLAQLNVPSNYVFPRYRGINIESFTIDSTPCTNSDFGVLAENDGTIRGLWMDFMGESDTGSYRMGVDITQITHVIESLQRNEIPKVKIIDAEFRTISIVGARTRGVSEKWIAEMEKKETYRFQFLCVSQVSCPEDRISSDEDSSDDESSSADDKNVLQVDDVVLTVNGKLISRFGEWEAPLYDPRNQEEGLDFLILRDRKEVSLKVKAVEVHETDHTIMWCGAQVQKPHHNVRQSLQKLPSQVYISKYAAGSPASQYGIGTTNFITHVNEVATPTLETFLGEVKKIPDDTYCKLRVVTFDDVPFAISLKTNYHYFSTTEVKKNAEGKWEIISYDKDYKVEKVESV